MIGECDAELCILMRDEMCDVEDQGAASVLASRVVLSVASSC